MAGEELLATLAACGALLEGHFELSSGRHSDRYFQCALALAEPRRAERLAADLARRLPADVRERTRIVLGPALGAVVLAHELARALGARAMFSERAGDEMRLRRGFRLEPDEGVLLAEDVLTTGGSLREVAALVREAGARALGVAALVDRTPTGDPFADEGLPLFALARVEARSWDAADCPLCARGLAPEKPGSRPAAERAAAREPRG